MTGPAWLAAGFASLVLLIAASSATRLILWRLRGQTIEADTDALHVAMGVAMAGMFEPRLSPVPDGAWRAVFVAAAAWFIWQAAGARGIRRSRGRTCAQAVPHAIECAAMVYMLLPGRTVGQGPAMAMPGMGGTAAANPAIVFVLALCMLGYVLWTADQLTAMSRATAAATPNGATATIPVRAIPGALAPRLAACCKIGMSIAMGFMLITLL
jgi:hypothetical protein